MTMVDNLLAERGTTAKGRPPDATNPAGHAPGKRIPRFGKIMKQMEQDGGSQTNNDQSSNKHTGNSPNRSATYLSRWIGLTYQCYIHIIIVIIMYVQNIKYLQKIIFGFPLLSSVSTTRHGLARTTR